MTFVNVQRRAAEAGLTMSRDFTTLRIRLRYRNRPNGRRWLVESLAEAMEVIARCEQKAGQDGS